MDYSVQLLRGITLPVAEIWQWPVSYKSSNWRVPAFELEIPYIHPDPPAGDATCPEKDQEAGV